MKSKVIIWWATDGDTAEKKLNTWLSDNDAKEIVTVSQSESGNTTATRRITYTIFYK